MVVKIKEDNDSTSNRKKIKNVKINNKKSGFGIIRDREIPSFSKEDEIDTEL